MNNLIGSNIKTMSSREIADLTGKRHDHVCRDIENLNATYEGLGFPKVGEGYYTHPNTGSQQHRQFVLTRDQSTDLITGYNAELRIKINRRWMELENQKPKELSRMDLIQMALQAEQENIALRSSLEIAAPKVDFFDRVGERTNLMNATQVAQQLHMTAQKLNKLLDEFDVYNKKVIRGRVFKDWFIKQGLGEMKQTDLGFPQALFTTKGEQWIIQQFTSEGLI